MKIKKSALLYDIANIAYIIAHTSEGDTHVLHTVTDICEEGNRDRVARVLDLAYSKASVALSPVIDSQRLHFPSDYSKIMRTYEVPIRKGLRFPPQLYLKILETVREYMVSMVIADWLGLINKSKGGYWEVKGSYWKKKSVELLGSLMELASSNSVGVLPRRVPPI